MTEPMDKLIALAEQQARGMFAPSDKAYPREVVYRFIALSEAQPASDAHPSGGDELALEEMLACAYHAGAMEVHKDWLERHPSGALLDNYPEFGEAASDYAKSIDLTALRQPTADSGEGEVGLQAVKHKMQHCRDELNIAIETMIDIEIKATAHPVSRNAVLEEADLAQHLYLAHVSEYGFPNGLPTWEELPEKHERLCGDVLTKFHWRGIASYIRALGDAPPAQ